MHKRLLTTKVR